MSEGEQKTDLVEQQAKPLVQQDGPLGYLMDTKRFEHLWRVAQAFAASALVPETFRKRPNDCFIACQLAIRLRVDPFMLMQKLYVVHGRPGMEAQLVTALLNASGKIDGVVRYEFSGEGDDYGCLAYVVDSHTGERVDGPKVAWKTVKGEGWDKPKGNQKSKWQTMPEQMFRYRAASFLVKAHYPEVMMGLQTREELEDSIVDVNSRLAEPADAALPRPASKAEAIEAELAAGNGNGSGDQPQPGEAEPAAEAEVMSTSGQGDDGFREDFERFVADLAKTTGINACVEMGSRARAALPECYHDRIDQAVRERQEAIRAGQGLRSNVGKQESLLAE